MGNKIRHVGIVESVAGDNAKVRIVQSSACELCKAARLCHASESKEKIIDVYTDTTKLKKGQKIMVVASYNVGLVAVSLAMLIPLFLLLAVIAVCSALGYSEMTSAVFSLMALIPYFVILFLFRKQINRKVTFNVETLG